MRVSIFLVTALFVAVTLTPPAWAEVPVQLIPLTRNQQSGATHLQKIGDWTISCKTDVGCQMMQTVSEDNFAVTMSVQPENRTNCQSDMIATLTLPHGLFLGKPLAFKIDKRTPMYVPVRSCFASGCLAAVQVKGAIKNALRAGNALRVTADWLDGSNFVPQFSLQGFVRGSATMEVLCQEMGK